MTNRFLTPVVQRVLGAVVLVTLLTLISYHNHMTPKTPPAVPAGPVPTPVAVYDLGGNCGHLHYRDHFDYQTGHGVLPAGDVACWVV